MIYIFLIAAALVFTACAPYACARAEEGHSAVIRVEEGAEPINMGNAIDPVTGQEIDPENFATFEYSGKIYNFYSEESIGEFKKYPDVYVGIVEDELKARAQEKIWKEEQERLKPAEPVSSYNEEHLF